MKQKELKTFFNYCPSGNLIRLKKTTSKTKIGEKVGGHTHSGYRLFSFKGKRLYLHRAIYAWHFGEFKGVVDHIDRDPSNNKIENLRAVSQQKNMCNQSLSKTNTSGTRGLYFCKRDEAFYGQIVFKGKTINVGWSKNKNEVVKKLENKRKELYAS